MRSDGGFPRPRRGAAPVDRGCREGRAAAVCPADPRLLCAGAELRGLVWNESEVHPAHPARVACRRLSEPCAGRPARGRSAPAGTRSPRTAARMSGFAGSVPSVPMRKFAVGCDVCRQSPCPDLDGRFRRRRRPPGPAGEESLRARGRRASRKRQWKGVDVWRAPPGRIGRAGGEGDPCAEARARPVRTGLEPVPVSARGQRRRADRSEPCYRPSRPAAEATRASPASEPAVRCGHGLAGGSLDPARGRRRRVQRGHLPASKRQRPRREEVIGSRIEGAKRARGRRGVSRGRVPGRSPARGGRRLRALPFRSPATADLFGRDRSRASTRVRPSHRSGPAASSRRRARCPSRALRCGAAPFGAPRSAGSRPTGGNRPGPGLRSDGPGDPGLGAVAPGRSGVRVRFRARAGRGAGSTSPEDPVRSRIRFRGRRALGTDAHPAAPLRPAGSGRGCCGPRSRFGRDRERKVRPLAHRPSRREIVRRPSRGRTPGEGPLPAPAQRMRTW